MTALPLAHKNQYSNRSCSIRINVSVNSANRCWLLLSTVCSNHPSLARVTSAQPFVRERAPSISFNTFSSELWELSKFGVNIVSCYFRLITSYFFPLYTNVYLHVGASSGERSVCILCEGKLLLSAYRLCSLIRKSSNTTE